MKRSELFFSAIQVPIDFSMFILAAITAYSIRNIPEVIALKPKLYDFPFETYIKVVIIAIPIFLLVFAIEGLYDIRATRKFWKEALKIFTATSIGLMVLIVAIFLKREWFSSRFVILSGWVMATFYIVMARFAIQLIQKWLLRKYEIGVHRVLLIGRNNKIKIMSEMFENNKNLGYKVVDNIDNAHLKEIKEVRTSIGIDEIILCEPAVTDDEQEKLIDFCNINSIVYKLIPTTLQTSNFSVGVINGEPIIEVKNTPLDGWGRIIKRAFDIVASTFGIAITSPIMLLTGILIRLDSPGPIIYRNERIGINGKKFYVYKFRYLKWEYCIARENNNLEKALELEKDLIAKQSVRRGPLYKIKNDPRKTRVGRIIERLSIDEFPQFFNVLFGSMSMVGPRPHQKREVEKYMDYHRRLLTIKPGVTGMAQVSGRSDIDFEDEYKLDLFYIENWSLWMDILVCLKTIGSLFKSRNNL